MANRRKIDDILKNSSMEFHIPPSSLELFFKSHLPATAGFTPEILVHLKLNLRIVKMEQSHHEFTLASNDSLGPKKGIFLICKATKEDFKCVHSCVATRKLTASIQEVAIVYSPRSAFPFPLFFKLIGSNLTKIWTLYDRLHLCLIMID